MRIFPSLILLLHAFVIDYVFYAKKASADWTYSTYPKSAPG